MEESSSRGMPCAVHDPSHRKDGSYWQWHSASHDSSWDVIANAVAAGWPSTAGTLASPRSELYGVVDGPGCWLYRVFPAGRDSFGRPGRYFSVVFQLRKPEDCLDPRVSGILKYFEGERSLPLECSALDQGVPSGTPSETIRKVVSLWAAGNQGKHWGIDEKGSIRRFVDVDAGTSPARPTGPPSTDSEPETPSQTGSPGDNRNKVPRVRCCVACFALGTVVGCLGGYLIAQMRQGWTPAERPQQGVSVPDTATTSSENPSAQRQVPAPQKPEGESNKP